MDDHDAKISVRETGPYLASNLKALRNANGEPLEAKPRYVLCRCGQSSKKPFCDGTHGKIGFSAKPVTPLAGKTEDYAGKEVTLHYNAARCAHIGHCTDNLPGVFRYGEEPWIVPDGAPTEQVIAAVNNCPSGALSYSIAGKKPDGPAGEPEIRVSRNGPLFVTGGVALDEILLPPDANPQRYALCRCGHSKTKPFCDGSHWDAKFTDPGV